MNREGKAISKQAEEDIEKIIQEKSKKSKHGRL
jgi:hypothetical protein